MFRKLLLITLSVCILSSFLIQNVSYADDPETLNNHLILLSNRIDEMDLDVKRYNTIRGYLKELIDAWDQYNEAVRKGTKMTVTVGSAI